MLVFDRWRKKYVSLTPEEWVRQNFVMYLVGKLNFPERLIAVEKGLKVAQKSKRTDVVVYDNQGSPLLIVECKAPGVKISSEVFDQIVRYNIALNVNYLVVTNGMEHYCCKLNYQSGTYSFLKNIPYYKDLV